MGVKRDMLPQAGIFIFPGRANVYRKPSYDAERIGLVVAGSEVQVTGFTDDPDGARWYRFNVVGQPTFSNAWIRDELPDRGSTYPTIRLDGGAALNDALYMDFSAAMQ